MHYLDNHVGLGDLFDATFYSAAAGFKKPQPEFYAYIEEALQLAPQHLLFWDDRQENVEGARSCGWYAEKYEGFEKFENKIQQYLTT